MVWFIHLRSLLLRAVGAPLSLIGCSIERKVIGTRLFTTRDAERIAARPDAFVTQPMTFSCEVLTDNLHSGQHASASLTIPPFDTPTSCVKPFDVRTRILI